MGRRHLKVSPRTISSTLKPFSENLEKFKLLGILKIGLFKGLFHFSEFPKIPRNSKQIPKKSQKDLKFKS